MYSIQEHNDINETKFESASDSIFSPVLGKNDVLILLELILFITMIVVICFWWFLGN